MSIEYIAGQRFKNLTLIKIMSKIHIEPSGKKRKIAKVQCDCGHIFELQTLYLHRKGQSCSKCRKHQSMSVSIGEQYDKLTVIDFASNPRSGRTESICKCICGKIVSKRSELLRSNQTNNCGCLPRGGWQGVGKIHKTVFSRVKHNAKVRNLTCKITLQYMWDLFCQQDGKCALTNVDIGFSRYSDENHTASLDRIDSTKGYIKGNVQWVHKDINLMKMDFEQDKFIHLCELVVKANMKC